MNPLTPSPRDWPEDFAHENGNYLCRCVGCHETFHGHKRRYICHVCADQDAAKAKHRAEWLTAHKAPLDWVVLTSGEIAQIRADYANQLLRVHVLEKVLREIRALKPRRMGDHWSWEEGLKPDDVFDPIDEVLKPEEIPLSTSGASGGNVPS